MTDEIKPELTETQRRDHARLDQETKARNAMHERQKQREAAERAAPKKDEEPQ